MEQTMYLRIRRLLWTGLLASVITVLGGELPIGWVEYPVIEGDVTGLLGMMAGSGRLSMGQLACGALFGGVCIPLQYYGFEGVSQLVAQGGSRKAARIIHAGALATGFWGGIVHVICVALMFVCRGMEAASGVLPGEIMDFTLWLVMPVSVVFMPVYYGMLVAMLAAVLRGRTCLPRWVAVFNPLTATVLLNALPMILPASPLVNALGMANMGVGSVLTFAGWLALLHRQQRAA